MESIPQVLNYSSSSALFRINEFASFPQEGNQSANGRYTVKLPQKSIINLSSLRVSFTNTVSGLGDTGVGDYVNTLANCASYKLFRSIMFRVGGTIVSGNSNQYDQIYSALSRACLSKEVAQSKIDCGYQDFYSFTDEPVEAAANLPLKGRPGVTTKSAFLTMTDILGLSHSGTEAYIDTSLMGDIDIIFDLNSTIGLTLHKAGASHALSAVNFTLSNFVVNVKCITSISPLYVEMLANRLQSKAPIRIPYENYVSTITNNGTASTLSVNSGCIDKLLVAPFSADPNVAVSLASDNLNQNHYKFDSGRTRTNANSFSYQARINNEYYPKTQVKNALELASITTEALFGGSDASAQNMLFLGNIDADGNVYNKNQFLSQNCILVQKFCIQEGWAGSKTATGISTNGSMANIDLAYTNFGSYLLICAFMTSYLVYDPSSGSVNIEA